MSLLELKDAVNESRREAEHAIAEMERQRACALQAKRRIDDVRDRVQSANRLVKLARVEKRDAANEVVAVRNAHCQLEDEYARAATQLADLKRCAADADVLRRRDERIAAQERLDAEAKVHRRRV